MRRDLLGMKEGEQTPRPALMGEALLVLGEARGLLEVMVVTRAMLVTRVMLVMLVMLLVMITGRTWCPAGRR